MRLDFEHRLSPSPGDCLDDQTPVEDAPHLRGAAVPAGRHVGWARRQLRAVLGACDQGRALPVRLGGRAGDRAHRAAGVHRRGLARLPAGRAAGHRLRLPRARPVRARCRAPLQPEQAAARPVRAGAQWRAAPRAGDLRLRGRPLRRRPELRRPRQRRLRPEMPGDRPRLHLGPRPPAARAVGRHDLLRDARARLHHPPSGAALRAGRHLRRPGVGGGGGAPARSGRHLDRAAADPHVRRRRPPGTDRPQQLLGLQHAGLLRARPALRVRRRQCRVRVQGDGGAPAPGRARGDPRRRLQPHRRGQRAGPDAVVQGHRQRLLLPAAAGPGALLRQRHRHREHRQPQPSARAADGHRQPALLGERDARRRVPLRPGDDPGARELRLRRGRRLPRQLPAGSGAVWREADRRAVGLRPGRLPGRRLSARLGRMERPLPRHRARFLARAGLGRRAGAAAQRLGRQASTGAAGGPGPR